MSGSLQWGDAIVSSGFSGLCFLYEHKWMLNVIGVGAPVQLINTQEVHQSNIVTP
ncbi:hypothetical protein BCU30_022890 [Vibrio lentus]|uniref:hypothetical protein n=1 Tax=Vibrio lentus TaxID=136468 RepID=UPI0012FFEA81|nr:hypothetical protein [Vibrio lentus]